MTKYQHATDLVKSGTWDDAPTTTLPLDKLASSPQAPDAGRYVFVARGEAMQLYADGEAVRPTKGDGSGEWRVLLKAQPDDLVYEDRDVMVELAYPWFDNLGQAQREITWNGTMLLNAESARNLAHGLLEAADGSEEDREAMLASAGVTAERVQALELARLMRHLRDQVAKHHYLNAIMIVQQALGLLVSMFAMALRQGHTVESQDAELQPGNLRTVQALRQELAATKAELATAQRQHKEAVDHLVSKLKAQVQERQSMVTLLEAQLAEQRELYQVSIEQRNDIIRERDRLATMYNQAEDDKRRLNEELEAAYRANNEAEERIEQLEEAPTEALPEGQAHDTKEGLGAFIRERRVAAGLSLREVAEGLGVSAVALGQIERGVEPNISPAAEKFGIWVRDWVGEAVSAFAEELAKRFDPSLQSAGARVVVRAAAEWVRKYKEQESQP